MLTVTAGGIQANQSATINVPVTIGAPQTWTTALGMTLNVSGAVHTIISDLTINHGATIIGGPIDGGGVINAVGGNAPGNLIKNGAGTLTLSGASNYPGTIALNAGLLSLAPVAPRPPPTAARFPATARCRKTARAPSCSAWPTHILAAPSRSIRGS